MRLSSRVGIVLARKCKAFSPCLPFDVSGSVRVQSSRSDTQLSNKVGQTCCTQLTDTRDSSSEAVDWLCLKMQTMSGWPTFLANEVCTRSPDVLPDALENQAHAVRARSIACYMSWSDLGAGMRAAEAISCRLVQSRKLHHSLNL